MHLLLTAIYGSYYGIVSACVHLLLLVTRRVLSIIFWNVIHSAEATSARKSWDISWNRIQTFPEHWNTSVHWSDGRWKRGLHLALSARRIRRVQVKQPPHLNHIIILWSQPELYSCSILEVEPSRLDFQTLCLPLYFLSWLMFAQYLIEFEYFW